MIVCKADVGGDLPVGEECCRVVAVELKRVLSYRSSRIEKNAVVS